MLPEAALLAASVIGIDCIAFTDHIHIDTDLSILDNVRSRVLELNPSIKTYIGCEADIISVGSSVISSELVEKTDFIMAAANHFHDPTISQPQGTDRASIARHYLEMFSYAVNLENVDVIAHPFFVMPGYLDPLGPSELTERDLAPAIEIAARSDVAMEISRRALTPGQAPFIFSFYKLCKEAGLKFTVGSDAHKPSDVGMTRLVEPLIRELGLTDEDFWLPERKRVKSVE